MDSREGVWRGSLAIRGEEIDGRQSKATRDSVRIEDVYNYRFSLNYYKFYLYTKQN